MEIEDVKQTFERKGVRMSIRTTETVSKFMKDNKISPQLVFDKSVEELMEKSYKVVQKNKI